MEDTRLNQRLQALVRTRWPELAIVALGISLRVSMLVTYDVSRGYDFPDHWLVVDWWRQRFEIPPLMFSREAYHPPLYYVLTGLLARAHNSLGFIAGFSVVLGSLRLFVIWAGLELYLPGKALARRTALALAAVISSSVHLDGMITGEALNNLFGAMELVAMPLVFRAEGKQRVVRASLLGASVALHLLTKVSAMSVIGAVGLGGLFELVQRRELKRFVALAVGLAVVAAGAGWYFARNQRLYGHAFLSGYDGQDGHHMRGWALIPYLERRQPAFVLGWSMAPYESPYFPAGVLPESRFFPVLVTSAFVDYYNHGFGSPKGYDGPSITKNTLPIRESVVLPSRQAAIAGSFIALVTLIAWCAAMRWAVRAREHGFVAALCAPLVALVGQLHFAWGFPVDGMGPVKGLYMQFSAPVLYALFGLAVAWLWRKGRAGQAVAGLCFTSLGLVGWYTIYCRFF